MSALLVNEDHSTRLLLNAWVWKRVLGRTVSQRANDALAVVDDPTPCSEFLDEVAQPARWHGRHVRASRTSSPEEVALLVAILRGEFVIAGFRDPETATAEPHQWRRVTVRDDRGPRILRAHGLIKKPPKSHCYRLTLNGHLLTATLSVTRNAAVKLLPQQAA